MIHEASERTKERTSFFASKITYSYLESTSLVIAFKLLDARCSHVFFVMEYSNKTANKQHKICTDARLSSAQTLATHFKRMQFNAIILHIIFSFSLRLYECILCVSVGIWLCIWLKFRYKISFHNIHLVARRLILQKIAYMPMI